MAPDTQSIAFNATYPASDLALAFLFESSAGHSGYADHETLNAAIKRADLDDEEDEDEDEDDEDEDDEEDDDEEDDDEYDEDDDEEEDEEDDDDDEDKDDEEEEDELNLI